jgi:hypothetical protein
VGKEKYSSHCRACKAIRRHKPSKEGNKHCPHMLTFFDIIILHDAGRTTTNLEMERIEERAVRNVIRYILRFVIVRKNYKNGM